MKKKICLLLCLVLVMSTAAYGFASEGQGESVVKGESLTLENSKKLDTKFVNYDFGSRKIKNANPKGLPYKYKLRGILSYPKIKKGKLKPIIILHGQHDNDNKRRYDVGFKYLVDYLAANGYLAISMDINGAYHWKDEDNQDRYRTPYMFAEQIKVLKKLNRGSKNKYKVNLKNKIDFNNVMLIGHSTAGTLINDLVVKEKKYGIKVKSIFALAPSDNFEGTKFDLPIKSINTLVPEYDGDVMGHDGMGIYESVRQTKNQKLNSGVLLRFANHNYFNTVVKKNDASFPPGKVQEQISEKVQRNFLKKYTLSLVKATLEGKITNTIFDDSKINVNEIDGLKVFTTINKNGNKKIVNDLHKPYEMTSGIVAKKIIESQIYNKDKALGLNVPLLGRNSISFEKFTWKEKGQKVTLPINTKDISNTKGIALRLLLDPSEANNTRGEGQGFSVGVKDGSGKIVKVTIPTTSDLIDYPLGEMIKDEVMGKSGSSMVFDGTTYIKQIRIPLGLLKGIDLTNVTELTLDFDQRDTGSIAFREIMSY
ncbi:MAG: hypothetical protein RSA49_02130 [Anaerovoracaceae bacterium]